MRTYFLVSPPLKFNEAVDFLQQSKGQDTEFGEIVNLLSWQLVPVKNTTDFFIVVIRAEVQYIWEKEQDKRSQEAT